jgi:hypothetical protein
MGQFSVEKPVAPGSVLSGNQQAERGMLNTFASICSGACLSYYASEILDHTIKNWIEYVRTAAGDHAVFNTPTKPTIGFLIKYPRPALNLWLWANNLEMKDCLPQSKALVRSEPVNKLSVPEMWPDVPPPPPHPKMTWEEIMADPDDNDL